MKKHSVTLVSVLAVIMLFVALFDMSSGFYALLRWVICASAVYCAVYAHAYMKFGWMVVFGLVAYIFNPIEPFYLGREGWSALDAVGIAAFILGGLSVVAARDKFLKKYAHTRPRELPDGASYIAFREHLSRWRVLTVQNNTKEGAAS
jgi:hypothetical protein